MVLHMEISELLDPIYDYFDLKTESVLQQQN